MFASPLELSKGKTDITAYKYKDYLTKFKMHSVDLIEIYESSGNGENQKSKEDEDWGSFLIFNFVCGEEFAYFYLSKKCVLAVFFACSQHASANTSHIHQSFRLYDDAHSNVSDF